MRIFDPFIIIIRTLKISRLRSIIINWFVPIITLILLYCLGVIISPIDISVDLTISSIILGFNASILTMLVTVDNSTTKELKNRKLNNNQNYTMHEGLIYKFGYVVIILIIHILILIISTKYFKSLNFINYISLFLIINTLLVMMETVSETIFVYSKDY